MRQVERQKIGLFPVTTSRHLALGPFHDYAAIEPGQIIEFLWRHPVVDELLEQVGVGFREYVGNLVTVDDCLFPRIVLVPDEHAFCNAIPA